MRDELARQLTRRRTRVLLAAMLVIPVVLAIIFVLRGAPELTSGATPRLVNLADGSGLAFTAFVLLLCAPLLLLAVAATFAGDALASEHGWGTLRYVLVAPVLRHRLLARKLAASVLLSIAATALLLAASLAAGTIAFGWHPLDTPVGGELSAGTGLARVLIAGAYVAVTLLPFVALSLLFATVMESPLGAVGASMAIAVLSQILDLLTTLGSVRVVLPTHYAYAWVDLFVDPPNLVEISRGTLQATCWAVASCAIAWWAFARRDING